MTEKKKKKKGGYLFRKDATFCSLAIEFTKSSASVLDYF